jgi:Right handed beta helix region
VSLEGLQVNGGGNGINFASGSELRVKDCVVSNMELNGIQLTATGAAIFMNDVDVHDNGQSGILVSG